MPAKEKAQTSIEFVLITGAFIVIAITVMPLIFREFELSKAVAASRDGAEFAIAMRGMGYDSPTGSVTGVPTGAIKIKNVTFETSSSPPVTCDIAGKTWYRLKFYVYAPSYVLSNSSWQNSIEGTLQSYARGNLYRAFYGSYDPGTAGVETDRYCFTIGYSFMPYSS